MKKINYKDIDSKFLNAEIVAMLNVISEFKGKEEVYLDIKKDVLDTLIEAAKIQSIESSNKIEGIFTTNERLRELVIDNAKPKNRSEQEITGYKEVLKIIHSSYKSINISSNYILQLHKELLSYSNLSYGGKYKNSQNYIAETDSSGNSKILFTPVAPFETEDYVRRICEEYNDYIKENNNLILLLIPIFIVDFLCIHPFNDGNGRISRLLSLLLLYKNGYHVGKYISIERLIEKTKESYYESLRLSDIRWHENKNDYTPFIKYFLGIIIKAYRELETRIGDIGETKITKTDRVTNIILSKLGKLTKKSISEEAPDVSITTIERIITKLVKDEKIIKHLNGPKTYYTVNFEKK